MTFLLKAGDLAEATNPHKEQTNPSQSHHSHSTHHRNNHTHSPSSNHVDAAAPGAPSAAHPSPLGWNDQVLRTPPGTGTNTGWAWGDA